MSFNFGVAPSPPPPPPAAAAAASTSSSNSDQSLVTSAMAAAASSSKNKNVSSHSLISLTNDSDSDTSSEVEEIVVIASDSDSDTSNSDESDSGYCSDSWTDNEAGEEDLSITQRSNKISKTNKQSSVIDMTNSSSSSSASKNSSDDSAYYEDDPIALAASGKIITSSSSSATNNNNNNSDVKNKKRKIISLSSSTKKDVKKKKTTNKNKKSFPLTCPRTIQYNYNGKTRKSSKKVDGWIGQLCYVNKHATMSKFIGILLRVAPSGIIKMLVLGRDKNFAFSKAKYKVILTVKRFKINLPTDISILDISTFTSINILNDCLEWLLFNNCKRKSEDVIDAIQRSLPTMSSSNKKWYETALVIDHSIVYYIDFWLCGVGPNHQINTAEALALLRNNSYFNYPITTPKATDIKKVTLAFHGLVFTNQLATSRKKSAKSSHSSVNVTSASTPAFSTSSMFESESSASSSMDIDSCTIDDQNNEKNKIILTEPQKACILSTIAIIKQEDAVDKIKSTKSSILAQQALIKKTEDQLEARTTELEELQQEYAKKQLKEATVLADHKKKENALSKIKNDIYNERLKISTPKDKDVNNFEELSDLAARLHMRIQEIEMTDSLKEEGGDIHPNSQINGDTSSSSIPKVEIQLLDKDREALLAAFSTKSSNTMGLKDSTGIVFPSNWKYCPSNYIPAHNFSLDKKYIPQPLVEIPAPSTIDQDVVHRGCVLVDLPRDDPLFVNILNRLCGQQLYNIHAVSDPSKIVNIFQIQHPVNYMNYQQAKSLMQVRLSSSGIEFEKPYLFHGTGHSYVKPILQNGLNVNYREKVVNANLFGSCVYTAIKPYVSVSYACSSPHLNSSSGKTEYHMFVVSGLTGRTEVGSDNQMAPRAYSPGVLYDCTTDHVKDYFNFWKGNQISMNFLVRFQT